MGPYLLQLPTASSLTSLSILQQKFPLPNNSNVNFVFCCLSYRSGGRFQFEDEPYFDDGEFQFAGAKKQRMWWSDRLDFEEDDDEEYWMVKMFKAFGVMLPAIAISVLLGTGPNAFLMALAVPVGQSLLSLVFDIVKGRNRSGWRSAPRSKKQKPFATASHNFKTRKGKQEGRGNSSYQSWAQATDNFQSKGAKRGSKYGGWDQLDMEDRRSQRKASSMEPNDQSPVHEEGKDKLSRMGRFQERPLLLRLLIAFFPFLGSFTPFLF